MAEGLDAMVASTFGRVTGLVAMQPAAPMPLFSRIPADWAEDLRAVPGVESVNAEVWQRVNLIEDEVILSPPRLLFGIDIENRLKLRESVYRDDVFDGRFLQVDDRGSNNCVVSRQIAEQFGKGVGDTLRVEEEDLQIVGIYQCGSLLLDVAILVDVDRVREMTRFSADLVSSFYIEPSLGEDSGELSHRIEEAFRGRRADVWQPSALMEAGRQGSGNVLTQMFRSIGRSIQPRDDVAPPADGLTGNDTESTPLAGVVDTATAAADVTPDPKGKSALEVRSSVDWAEKINDFSGDLDLFLTIMTSIGVIIAVLSIVNTMLMSVSERIIEFGILKANGWSRRDVMRLITFESAILGVGGGMLGCALGWGATQVGNWYYPTRIYLYASPELLGFGVLFATLLGVLGGLYPAVWAMRMVPMDAIRRG